MKTYSVYRLADGVFTGARLCMPEVMLALNTPAGCALIEGEFDAATQRVDLATGGVAAWRQAAEPAEAAAQANRRVLQQIAQLERNQARPLRQLAIDPADTDARARVVQIEAAIARLRLELQ